MLDKSADKFVVAHSKCRWMMMESNLLLLLLLPKLLPQPLLPRAATAQARQRRGNAPLSVENLAKRRARRPAAYNDTA